MPRANRRAVRDMRRALITPEGVDLRIVLADAGTRAAAFIIDATIMLATMIVVTLILGIGLTQYGVSAGQPIMVAWLILFFLLRNCYFILFEGGRKAATPGKRLNRLRVIARDGSGLTLDQVVARNAMREIEVFLPLTFLLGRAGAGLADTGTTLLGLVWALLFTFFPLFNRDRLRIGDLFAGTTVIRAPRHQLLVDLAHHLPPAATQFRFSETQLDAYGISELHRLEEVLRGDNEAACWVVARAISERIGWPRDIVDARPFLTAYYEGLRTHLEREVLFGVRRADKTGVVS